jgi:hypothetical protein
MSKKRSGRNIIEEAHDRVRSIYGSVIGRSREEVLTPALLLDLDILRANLSFMKERMSSMPTKLRAHVKVHKSPHIARMQIEAGAIGVGTATVWEAIVMARTGISDVFVINQLVGPEKTRALALLAREADAKVAVDDKGNVDELSRAAVAAGSTIGVLIEIDTGMRRCGVTDKQEALTLAQRIAGLPGLRFLGLTGYEGHCTLEQEREKRQRMAREAMDCLRQTGYPARYSQQPVPVPGRSPRRIPSLLRSSLVPTPQWTLTTMPLTRASSRHPPSSPPASADGLITSSSMRETKPLGRRAVFSKGMICRYTDSMRSTPSSKSMTPVRLSQETRLSCTVPILPLRLATSMRTMWSKAAVWWTSGR